MASNGYREAERRLVILRITVEGDGMANDRLLRNGLEHWGLKCTLGQVRTSLDWLKDRGLVECEDLLSSSSTPVRKVRITGLGRRVANGEDEIEGVTPRRLVGD